MAAQFVTLVQAKTHLRIATAPGHPDDADIQEKLDAAEAAILRYVARSPAGAALVEQYVEDLDAPADLRAAVLLQLGELWRFRGDDPATLALAPARDAATDFAPGVLGLLRRFGDPVLA